MALGTAQTTAMIFLVLLGADQLNTALALSQMPTELATWVKDSGFPPLLVMVAILLIYVLLGCVMDSLAMILLTIPVFYPVVMGLDFWGLPQTDKSIWFGILALMVVEIGLVHPPVGMNVYIINRLAKNVPLTETFKGVVPVPDVRFPAHHGAAAVPGAVAGAGAHLPAVVFLSVSKTIGDMPCVSDPFFDSPPPPPWPPARSRRPSRSRWC